MRLYSYRYTTPTTRYHGNALNANLAKRFVGTYIANDLVVLFAVEVDAKGKDFELPAAIVKRVAKFFAQEEAAYGTAAIKLHEQKSSMMDAIQHEYWQNKSASQKQMRLEDVWPKVLILVKESPTLQAQTWPAQWSLKVALTLKTSNAIIEGDANVKRQLKEVMTGHGKPQTIDCRMRAMRHGPKLGQKSLHTDDLLVKGVKEFLLTDRYLNSSGEKAHPEHLRDEHKANISLAKKKPGDDVASDGLVRFRSAEDHSVVGGSSSNFEIISQVLVNAADAKEFDEMVNSVEAAFKLDSAGSSLKLDVLAPVKKKTAEKKKDIAAPAAENLDEEKEGAESSNDECEVDDDGNVP